MHTCLWNVCEFGRDSGVNLYSKSKIICRANLSHVSHVFPEHWWRESGASKLLQGSDFTCCCFSLCLTPCNGIILSHNNAWKLSCLLNLVTFQGLRTSTMHDDIRYIYAFCIMLNCSQCSMHKDFSGLLVFSHVGWILHLIHQNFYTNLYDHITSIQGGWWVAGSPCGKGRYLKSRYTTQNQLLSFCWIFIFLPDAFYDSIKFIM